MKQLDIKKVYENMRDFASKHQIEVITAKTIDSPDYIPPMKEVDAHWHWTHKPASQGILSIRVGKRRASGHPDWLVGHIDKVQDVTNQLFRDAFMPEQSGPLTPEQHDEYLDHFLRGMTCLEAEDHIEYHERIAQALSAADPAYARTHRELSSTRRYLELARRFRDYGVAETITLTETFPKE